MEASPVFRAPKTSELIASHLRRQIVRGELAEGDVLPPEATLLEQFGVSRPTLREAFRVLESERLITVHRGARGGARVRTPSGDAAARFAGLILEHRNVKLADVLDARAGIEPACVGLLARRRTKADLRVLREQIEASERVAGAGPDQIRAGNDFHMLLVDRLGNKTLSLLNEMLYQITRRASLRAAETASAASLRRSWDPLRDDHHRLLDLLEAKDHQGAEALWKEHLDKVTAFLLSRPDATTVLDLLEDYDT